MANSHYEADQNCDRVFSRGRVARVAIREFVCLEIRLFPRFLDLSFSSVALALTFLDLDVFKIADMLRSLLSGRSTDSKQYFPNMSLLMNDSIDIWSGDVTFYSGQESKGWLTLTPPNHREVAVRVLRAALLLSENHPNPVRHSLHRGMFADRKREISRRDS